jgi:formylmethanofuran dehydrogenase subunit E
MAWECPRCKRIYPRPMLWPVNSVMVCLPCYDKATAPTRCTSCLEELPPPDERLHYGVCDPCHKRMGAPRRFDS